MNQSSSAALPANRCLTTVAVVPGTAPAAAGECPGQTEQLGNSAQYTYYVTPQLGASGACASVPGVTPLPTDRCITVVGTVNPGATNAVSRRVQMRASTKRAFTDFSRAGSSASRSCYSNNSLKFECDIGSNGHVDLRNSIDVYTSGSVSTGKVMCATRRHLRLRELGLRCRAAPRPTTLPSTLPADRLRVPREQTITTPRFPASVFNQTTRVFNIPSGDYTMPAGDLPLLQRDLGNSVKLSMSGSQRTRIYIDSPDRTGSVCGAGTGTFTRATPSRSTEVGRTRGAARGPHAWDARQ